MSTSGIPQGQNAISPYLAVGDARAMLEFVQSAFGAQPKEVLKTPEGTIMHCEAAIGDSIIMIGQAPSGANTMTNMIHMYTENCDTLYRQALDAGATVVREPEDQFYGDRNCAVADQFGNQWWIATRIENLTSEEIHNRLADMKQG